jgi:rubredoxin
MDFRAPRREAFILRENDMAFSPTDFECPKCESDVLNLQPFSGTEQERGIRLQCVLCGHVWTISEQPDVPPTSTFPDN